MPVTILVAEDSVTMRRVVEMTFAGEKDIRVVSVDSGNAALQKASELRPDVVIADGSMAGMDGYEVARAIKSDGNLANTAVILLASQKNPYDDARGKTCGVDDHVIKPFDTQHMIDRVQQVLGKPRAQAQGGAPLPKPSPVQMPSSMSATVPNVPAPVFNSPNTPNSPSGQMAASPKPSPVGLNSPVAKAAPVVSRAPAPVVAAKAAAPAPMRSPAAAATAANGDLAGKLAGLGLSADQVAGVLSLSREVIEQVVWEVVPDLAETLIREEIARLTAE